MCLMKSIATWKTVHQLTTLEMALSLPYTMKMLRRNKLQVRHVCSCDFGFWRNGFSLSV